MKSKQGKVRGNTALIACPTRGLIAQWRSVLEENFSVVELATANLVARYLVNLQPSILLLDLSLPELGGIEAITVLQGLSPSTRIILLTCIPDQKEAISALKAGAKGYCSIDIPSTLLMKAVEVVQGGEIWVARAVIPSLLRELTFMVEAQRSDPHMNSETLLALLTIRERHISQLVGDGLSNKEVALQLKISEKTVKAHLTTIFRKLDISDRLRLALLMAAYRRDKALASFDTNGVLYQDAI